MSEAELKEAMGHRVAAGEQSPLVLHGYSWEQYLSIDELFSDSGVRVRFLNGTLEIMAPVSVAHERRKSNIGRLVEAWCLARDLRFFGCGNATIKTLKQAGGEPDESYYFEEEKEFPDLVIEVALTSGGLSKRSFYKSFRVPELWFWRNEALEVFCWDSVAEDYVASDASRVLDGIDLAALSDCVGMTCTSDAIREFSRRCEL